MTLSCNWKKLESVLDGNAGNLDTKRRKKGIGCKIDTKSSSSPSLKVHKSVKTSRIMKMVESMNKEIESAKTKNNKEIALNENTSNSKKKKKKKKKPTSNNRKPKIGKYIALDCEFVGVGYRGKVSALARVTAVNYCGEQLLNLYVKPKEQVTDWRTWVSGIRPEDMKNAVNFDVARKAVADLIEGRILIGHSISKDLKVLRLSHPRNLTRDTAMCGFLKEKYGYIGTPSLKKLATDVLGIEIQKAEHSSLEDAKATLEIYKAHKADYDSTLYSRNNRND
ncbi:HHR086Wp [Eremothecium sinecaudum]|uniref:RNA exonuclease 4 n=1 Tax=Eremothecium sinecaudum TaxID=45286 RepID=A0A0X8HWP2_9SACH|nr:HHR086Wp [Eremothecium sinecaudum]AMD22855.1 HHR086Wp [Eremothecium sinecaudum]